MIPKRALEVAPIIKAKGIVRNKCEFTFGYRYLADDNPQDKQVEGSIKEIFVEASAPTVSEKVAEVDGSKDSTMKDSEATTATNEEKGENGVTDTAVENSEAATDATPTEEDVAIKKIPSIGAMAKGWSGGVSHPIGCRNIPSEAMALLEIVEAFLAECPMPPYNSKEHQGFWRTMTIRSSRRTRECMLIFVHAPLTGGAGSKNDDNVDNYTSEVFESEKARLLSMVTGKKFPTTYPKLEEEGEVAHAESGNDEKDTVEVTSVFFQEFGGISMPSPDHPVQVCPTLYIIEAKFSLSFYLLCRCNNLNLQLTHYSLSLVLFSV